MRIIKKFRKLPEWLRLILTALLGVIIGFITYEIIYLINPLRPRASSSWLMAQTIGIARQHALHRWLTFHHFTPYWKSLFRAYLMYSASLVLTSGLNWYLTEIIQMHHRIAWIICLLLAAMISLIFLRKYVFKTKS
jgi:putative flippase GtrA